MSDWKINKFNLDDDNTSNYFYLIKVLSYVLADLQSKKDFTILEKFKNPIVGNMAVELNDVVLDVLKLYPFDDIKKLHKIKSVLLAYEKQLYRYSY